MSNNINWRHLIFEFFDRSLYDFIREEFSFISLQPINPEISNKVEFTNVFTMYYSLLTQRFEAYKELKTESDSLFQTMKYLLE